MAVGAVVAFATVYLVVGGFEFLDRTNFALISLAAREPPLPVWAGAAAAFAVTSALAVAIGAVLLAVLPAYVPLLRLAGGALLLAYAAFLLLHRESERPRRAARSASLTAFLLILLLELGDTTMILTMNFVFTFGDPVLVGVAAGAGLATVAATATVVGRRLGARVEPARLDRLVIAILTGVGVVTIVYALAPGLFPSF